MCRDLDKLIIKKNHDKIQTKLLFQLILILTKFYPDMRHGQASLGNGHFNCCAEMGELMLIYVRDVSWLIKLSLEWQLRNRFLTKFSIKLTNSLNSDLSLETSLFRDHLVRGCFPNFATDKCNRCWSFFLASIDSTHLFLRCWMGLCLNVFII